VKPFNLEAAQRGEPIQLGPGYGTPDWQDVHFVGLSRNGLPVVQAKYNRESCLVIGLPEKLRMAPKKRTVFVNIYPIKPGARAAVCMAYDTEIDARATSGANAIAIARPVEIEE
jgi:hypothetical protein